MERPNTKDFAVKYEENMILTRRSLLLAFGASLFASATRKSLGPLGLEIYSLRRELVKDLPGTLALGRQFGFEDALVPPSAARPLFLPLTRHGLH